MIPFNCAQCGRHYNVRDEFAGRRGNCKSCGAEFTVPDQPVAPAFAPSVPVIQTAPSQAINYARLADPHQSVHSPVYVAIQGPTIQIKGTSGFGIASLVIGILTVMVSWVPILGMFAVVIAFIGLGIGVVGILVSSIGRKSGVGIPAAGATICLLAIVLGITMTGALLGALGTAAQQASASYPPSPSSWTPNTSPAPAGSFPRSLPIPPTEISPQEQSLQTQPAIQSHEDSSAEAAAKLKIAMDECLAPLKQSADYKLASDNSSIGLDKLNLLRQSNTTTGRVEASTAYLESVAIVKKMERDALASDDAVKTAKAALKSAEVREQKADADLKAKRLADAKSAEERAQIEADAIANLPVNVAIREHRLIRGMTYDEAVAALGNPYSISDDGWTRSATWERGSYNFWSAVFIFGKIDEISHTRL
jgi:hypothetical protein